MRRNRLRATVGVSAVALSAVGMAVGTAGASAPPAEGGGWTVNTDDCPDPDATNAPIEGEIRIGSAMPLSGGVAAAAFEPAARGFQAYVDYANNAGLLPGVTIVADIQDDQYNPALTPGVVDGLLDNGTHVITGLIGTGGAEAVRDTLNEECVPMLALLTGDPRWGHEVADYPWTIGLLTSYELESKGYAASIAEQFPGESVGLFYTNNAFGNVYMDAFRAAAEENGIAIVGEQNIEQTDEAPPAAQLQALADSGAGIIMATPLGAQCISFLNELANTKAATGWEPKVYITNTCASKLILGAAGPNADGIYTSAPMGLIDVENPETAAGQGAGYLAYMQSVGLGDIVTTGGAGWNAAEVTVAILIQAAASPEGLTQASIMNAARNLNYRPTLLREGFAYVTNGEQDGFYSEEIQIIQWSVANGYATDIGTPYSFESTPDAGEPTVAAPIAVG